MAPVKVSILCNTYNHEAYIASALDSFLMQKTDFPFEICVHDDASTDKTPEILKRYEASYPDLIKVIYQKENQFTQGKLIMELNSARAIGEYLAVCDGDDYWIDPLKLQKQADLLDQHPTVSLCIHAYYQKSVNSWRNKELIQYYPEDRFLSLRDLLEGPGRGYGYNTYMFRRKDLIMPEVFRTLRFTDLPRLMYSATIGEVAYLKTPMAVYRRGVPSSWSLAQFKDPAIHVRNHQRLKRFYEDLDEVTHHQATDLIKKRLAYSDLIIAIKTQDRVSFNALMTSNDLSFLSSLQKKRMSFELSHPKLVARLRSLKLRYWK